MSLSADLLLHAASLLRPEFNAGYAPTDVNIRRSISSSYYALFHRINEDAANLIAPNVPAEVNFRIRRWFDHAEMKRICGRFSKPQLDQPLLGLIGPAASSELRDIASSFILLQDARHEADYDLGYAATADDAHHLLGKSQSAIAAWTRLKDSAEANIFILSLLLWKNWEKGRI